MRVGVPKEIKTLEYRVGLTPAGARELARRGHQVMVETGAGAGAGFGDADYKNAGAQVIATAKEVFDAAEMIVKVKEPQPEEIARLRKDQILFTYLHLAADREQTEGLMRSGATCIAYETVTDDQGRLPLLAPMSEVAGRMSIQVGAHCLEKRQGGSGILLGGVPGVRPAKVVILGGGVSGANAVRMAVGMGADVTVIDKSVARLTELEAQFGAAVCTLYSTAEAIEAEVKAADLVIGAVLIAGASAPRLVTRDMVKGMRQGSVLVDIAIDQGGCFETSKPTTHVEPTYLVDGIVHYCVTNMPGAVPRTSTMALNNVTLPYMLVLAEKGARKAIADDKHLRDGLNVIGGKIVNAAVAQSLGMRAA